MRVYVDGQLAGLAPVYYTLYTGNPAPMLWSAVTSHTAHLLPTYTFDLGPWLPALNSPPGPGSSPHKITVELLGATNTDWQVMRHPLRCTPQ